MLLAWAFGAQEGVAQLQCKQPEGLVALMRVPANASPSSGASCWSGCPSRTATSPWACWTCCPRQVLQGRWACKVVHVPPLWRMASSS